jgi:hypothetical protein
MRTRRASFDPPNVQAGCTEVDLIPAQINQLTGAQAVPVGNKDHGGVAMTPTVLSARSL